MSTSLRGQELIDEISQAMTPNGVIAIWRLGQASVALRLSEATIYIDPFLTDSVRRLVPPPCTGDEVTNADLILLTHGHSDHFDVQALPLVARASPEATIVVPRPLVNRIAEMIGPSERIVPADAGRAFGWRGIEIVPVMARHEEFDMDPQLGYPYLGYVLRDQHVTMYHAGDTIPYDGLVDALAPLAIDLALLPINGRDYFRRQRGIAGNMDGREAAELASLLNVETVMPIHYDMFAGNTARPGEFVDWLQAIAPHIHVLLPGLQRSCLYRSTKPRQSADASKVSGIP